MSKNWPPSGKNLWWLGAGIRAVFPSGAGQSPDPISSEVPAEKKEPA
jgi:hypothetical protein